MTILFPYVAKCFEEAVGILSSEWQIEGHIGDSRKQHAIVQLMKDVSRKKFIANLGEDSAEAYRLAAVSAQSVPTRSFTSDIRPASSHDTDRLRHSPMGLMALMCPFELSNHAFVSTLAILLGVPVPYARHLQTQPGYHHIDPWGDSLLNDRSHAKWTASHNTIVRTIAQLATNYGVSTTGLTREVPVAEQGTSRRGDLSALASHVLCRRDHLNPDFPIGSQTQLVLDFTLGHTYTSSQRRGSTPQRTLKRGTLRIMESEKCATYKSDYHNQGHAFAPLVSNSFGQLGSEFLRFLWALADYAARNLVPVPVPIQSARGFPAADSEDDNSPRVRKFRRVRHAYYLKARTEVLLAVYEGISERIVGRTFALQNNPRFWFKIKDISTIWRPDLGSDAGPNISGDPGNSQNHAPASQSRSDVEGASTSQLAVCDSTSVSLSRQPPPLALPGGYAAALLGGRGSGSERQLPSLVSSPHRTPCSSGSPRSSGSSVPSSCV